MKIFDTSSVGLKKCLKCKALRYGPKDIYLSKWLSLNLDNNTAYRLF